MNIVHKLSSTRAMVFGAGVLLLGIIPGAFGTRRPLASGTERWVLQADRDPQCYYGSSWNDGDLMMPRAAHEQGAVRFTHEFPFEDGCTWQSVETLTPDGPNKYRYEYDEEPISCAEGAEPAPACPLAGAVLIVTE